MSPKRTLGLLAAVLVGGGCAHVQRSSNPDALTVAQVVAEARAQGLTLPDPTDLDVATRVHVREVVGLQGSQRERMQRIIRYLVDSGRLNFKYAANTSLTAQQAFMQRTGDCMAYTNLFVAMARTVDVKMHFVRITDLPVYYEHSGVFYVSSHMAAGLPSGGRDGFGSMVIDFASEQDDWRLGLYEPAKDTDDYALFYSNVAMDELVHGQSAHAEQILRFLIARAPQLRELYSNLGVVLMHERRYGDALVVLQEGMDRFPNYHPLFLNASQAARSVGQPELADEYLAHTKALAGSDPFFVFSRGINRYQQADYADAAREFRKAADLQPDNAVILTWMVRAYLSSGQQQEGVETYQRLIKVAPGSKAVSQLQLQFPALHPR